MHRTYVTTEDREDVREPQTSVNSVEPSNEETRIMRKSENLLLTWLLHLNRTKPMTTGELAKALKIPVYQAIRLMKDYPTFAAYMNVKYPVLVEALKQFMTLLPSPLDFSQPQVEKVSSAVKSTATLTLERDYRNDTLTWFPFSTYLTDEKEIPVARINYPGGTVRDEG